MKVQNYGKGEIHRRASLLNRKFQYHEGGKVVAEYNNLRELREAVDARPKTTRKRATRKAVTEETPEATE